MIKEYSYPSCGTGSIYVRCWIPEVEPVGIIQIIHGIAEHTARYDDFAGYLNELGYLVVAQDHMGHGKTRNSNQPLGYFYDGWFAATADTYRLLRDTMKQYPNVPYILFGHSMGSFLARTIIARYPDSGISGCIICGTGWMPESVLTMGKTVAELICRIKGDKIPSKLLQTLMFGSYNKRIEHPRSAYDWLTRDNEIVDAYIDDPNCGFIPCAGLVRDMMSGMLYIEKPKTLSAMNNNLPVLFIAGGDDPVGNYGAGVMEAATAFQNSGMRNVSMKLYPLCRHEILNELNRQEVYQDITDWIKNI